jgi:hypothetical protein
MKYIYSQEYKNGCSDLQSLAINLENNPFCPFPSRQTLNSNWKLMFVNGALVYLAPGYNRIYKFKIVNQINAFLFFTLYRLGFDITKIYSKKDIFLIASISSMNHTPRQINRILNKNPKIILVQHGGGFEERITPRSFDNQMIEQEAQGFLSWKYGSMKIAQTRFFISYPLFHINRLKPKIRVLCYGSLGPASERNILPFVECMSRNKMDIVVHLHPNPDLSIPDNVLNGLEALKVRIEKGLRYSVMRKNDIIVLDGPFHTLAYYLNYVKYQPLLIWSNSYNSALSRDAKRYYNNLKKDGYIIDLDKESCSEVYARMKEIYKSNGKFTRINNCHEDMFLYDYMKSTFKE